MFGFDNDYQILATYIYMIFDCICHTAYLSTLVDVVYLSSIGHKPLSLSCVAYHVAAAATQRVSSCHYEDIPYTLVIYLCMSQ